jgi:hypothetical protein
MNTDERDSVIRAYLCESAVFRDSGVFLSRYVTLQGKCVMMNVSGINIISRSKNFRRSAETVFLHGSAGRCGGAEIQFPHSGTAVKPYPGKTFRSADYMKILNTEFQIYE